jgi:hypothetical protein
MFGTQQDVPGGAVAGSQLDPAGLRKVLAEFSLCAGHDGAGLIEEDGARRRGALVERKQQGR